MKFVYESFCLPFVFVVAHLERKLCRLRMKCRVQVCHCCQAALNLFPENELYSRILYLVWYILLSCMVYLVTIPGCINRTFIYMVRFNYAGHSTTCRTNFNAVHS